MKCIGGVAILLIKFHISSNTHLIKATRPISRFGLLLSPCCLTLCHRLYASKFSNSTDADTKTSELVPETDQFLRTSLAPYDDSHKHGDVDQHIDSEFDALSLQEIKLDDLPRNFPPSCNLAAYVNQSETLQQFLKLGVDLSRWDEKQIVANFVVKLDFERDVKHRIQLLHDIGVPPDELGHYLTNNPYVLRDDENDLEVRINYLRSKKFKKEDIARIVSAAPLFLHRSTESIDIRLGYFQREFCLSGNDVRHVATRMPKLLTWPFFDIKLNQFILKEEFGFKPAELRQLLMTKPKLWTIYRKSLHERFDYVHNTMGISHELIVDFPGGLMQRLFTIKQRHLFLVSIGRAQYDPNLENYVSLKSIVSGNDVDFCCTVAKMTVDKFNEFLKTL